MSPQPSLFDGDTYEPVHDARRLTTQLDRVRTFMCDGLWHTIAEIHDAVGGSQAGISARLRDLRKPKNGGFEVQRRRVSPPDRGLFEYRMLPL